MKIKSTLILLTIITLTSCIPTRIAPNIKDYKVQLAKKFYRKLPRERAFIFEDPKDEFEFYDYINTKFGLDHIDVGYNSPFVLNGKTYYLSYREANIQDKHLNLPLVIMDAKRESNGNDPLFENKYTHRKDNWYLVLTVYDEDIKNCLSEDHKDYQIILKYLKDLKKEYLNTSNYIEVIMQKSPNFYETN